MNLSASILSCCREKGRRRRDCANQTHICCHGEVIIPPQSVLGHSSTVHAQEERDRRKDPRDGKSRIKFWLSAGHIGPHRSAGRGSHEDHVRDALGCRQLRRVLGTERVRPPGVGADWKSCSAHTAFQFCRLPFSIPSRSLEPTEEIPVSCSARR